MVAEELGGARSRPPLEFFFTQVVLRRGTKAVLRFLYILRGFESYEWTGEATRARGHV
jgi:hypothetical protein